MELMEFLQSDSREADETKKIQNCVYFVKFRSFEAENLKSTLEKAEKLMQIEEQARRQIIMNLNQNTSYRNHIYSKFVNISNWYMSSHFSEMMGWRKNTMESLLQAVDGYCCPSMNSSHGRSAKYPLSPAEEFNDVIMNLHCQLQHGSNNRAEEKHLLREIRKAETKRETLIANAIAERTKIPDNLDSREAIQSRIKAASIEIEELKTQRIAYTKYLKDKLKAAEEDVSSSLMKLEDMNQKKAKSNERIVGLRKQIDDLEEEWFNEYLEVLDSAKQLASEKDVEGLMELSKRQVENFMSQWSKNKDFRNDYEKRSLPFLESRHLSRDGIRMCIDPSRRAKRDFPKASQNYI